MFGVKMLATWLMLLSLLSPGSALIPPSTKLVLQHQRIQSRGEMKSLTMSLASSPATWILTSLAGGNIGTVTVARATKTWYPRINLPDWTPPNKVFPAVWTVLYSFIGYAAFKIYQLSGLASMRLALFHYALNITWAPVFFGMQRLRVAHVLNIALVATLLPIIPAFYSVNPLSGILLVPYLLWLLFATKLSDEICRLNPTVQRYNNAMLEADIAKLQDEAAKKAGL